MNFTEGRGLNRIKLAKENRKAVRKFFKENPGALQKECQEALGLSRPTISKYVKELRSKSHKKASK
jgi:predicted transcriptional regulator